MTNPINITDLPKGPIYPMTQPEIDQFLTCAPVGRISVILEGWPYIVPIGFGFSEGKVFFHSCVEGIKMEALRTNPKVCFEVDESLSDVSLSKSVIIFGEIEIISQKKHVIPYLQKLIDKYRVSIPFGEYMKRGGRNLKQELERINICLIKPHKTTALIRACFFGEGIDKMEISRGNKLN